MTKNENRILAERAVTAEGWRWMPGMRNTYKRRVSENLGELVWDDDRGRWEETGELESDCLPDLTDPATLGCLLALVRWNHGDERIHVSAMSPAEWRVEMDYGCLKAGNGEDMVFPSEAAALVAALEAAHARPE